MLFFLALTVTIANSQTIHFQGEIKGVKDSTKLTVNILPLTLGADVISKEVYCVDGKFSFSSNLVLPMWHLVRIDSDEFFRGNVNYCGDGVSLDIYCFAFPEDKISVDAEKAKYGVRFVATGNEISNQQKCFLDEIFPLEQQLADLTNQRREPFPEQELDDKIEHINKEIVKIKLLFMKKHPDWEYSAIILPEFDVETAREVYSVFSKNVKNSFFGKYAESFIKDRSR